MKNCFFIITMIMIFIIISCDMKIETGDLEIKTKDLEVQTKDLDINSLPLNIKYETNAILNKITRDKFILTIFLDYGNNLFNDDIDADNFYAYIENEGNVIYGDLNINSLEAYNKKIAYSIVMDYSGSMFTYYYNKKKKRYESIIQSLEKSVHNFVSEFDSTKDVANIIKFGSYVDFVSGFTNKKNKLKKVVYKRSKERGGTALYEAALKGLKSFKNLESNVYSKAIVLFTDGGNTVTSVSMNDVINYATKNHIPIFSIGLNSEGLSAIELKKLSKETGGFCYLTEDPNVIGMFYKRINNTFKNQYLITIEWDKNDLPPSNTQVNFYLRLIDDNKVLANFKKKIILP